MLLGGDDKGTDLAPLVEAARAHARAAVCFGAARERFAAAFGVCLLYTSHQNTPCSMSSCCLFWRKKVDTAT